MGKFLKYEDSNFRTFKVEITAVQGDDNDVTYTGKMIRPKKPITKDDLLGAIISMHQASETDGGSTVTMDYDIIMTSVGSVKTSLGTDEPGLYSCGSITIGDGCTNIVLIYDPLSDRFIMGMMMSDAEGATPVQLQLENVFVDEFGREQVKLD